MAKLTGAVDGFENFLKSRQPFVQAEYVSYGFPHSLQLSCTLVLYNKNVLEIKKSQRLPSFIDNFLFCFFASRCRNWEVLVCSDVQVISSCWRWYGTGHYVFSKAVREVEQQRKEWDSTPIQLFCLFLRGISANVVAKDSDSNEPEIIYEDILPSVLLNFIFDPLRKSVYNEHQLIIVLRHVYWKDDRAVEVRKKGSAVGEYVWTRQVNCFFQKLSSPEQVFRGVASRKWNCTQGATINFAFPQRGLLCGIWNDHVE